MKKLSISLLLVVIMIVSMFVVSAADTNASDDVAMPQDDFDTLEIDSVDDDVSQVAEDVDVLSADASKNFTQLQTDLSSGFLNMRSDYVRAEGESDISISGSIVILGDGEHKIDANKLGGIFNVGQSGTLTLNNVILVNGNSNNGGAIYNEGVLNVINTKLTDNTASMGGAIYNKGITSVSGSTLTGNNATNLGGAIYSDGTLVVDGSNLNDNTAKYRGGAIYNEGNLDVSGTTFDSNDITFRSANDDNGGAAVYNKGGILTMDDVKVTNNLKDIVIRNGNDGDLVNAVIYTDADATITNSYIANNTGSWGAGVYVTNGATLTVTGTTFEGNNATFGSAIYAEDAVIDVDDCIFNNNAAVGVGSSGTSNTQAGAILVMGQSSSASIINSRFKKNSANVGGAVSLAGIEGDSLIDNCTFIENTATSDGGAVYLWSDSSSVTVTDSEFINNTAPYGGAIENEGTGDLIVDGSDFIENTATTRGGAIISSGSTSVSNSVFTDNVGPGNTNAIYLYYPGATLALSNNTITGSDDAQILTKDGIDITTQVKVVILDGQAQTTLSPNYELTATVTDDNGNAINDYNFAFKVGDDEVPGTYYSSDAKYKADYTFLNPGTYLVTAVGYDDADITTSEVTFESPLKALQNLIDDANDGDTIELTYGFAYMADYDAADAATGVVIDKNIIINGNGVTIDGGDASRIFTVNAGNTLTLNNVTVSNGAAQNGAGIYVNEGATLNAAGVSFIDNTATYRGGAIYSEGTVSVDNSVFDKNDITYRSANDDNGGAAIYNLNGVLTINNTNITNSVKDIVIRDGNAGDLLVGVVVTSGETLINNSYFANNTGSWGGAISSLGYLNTQSNTLTVENTKFEGNNATFGGAIFVQSSKLVVDNCTFENNKGVGEGSTGTSMTQGGAIIVHPAGSSATITDSTFIGNSANVGGAVSLSRVDGNSIIDDCTFTDNTAASEGGAIYGYTTGTLTVSDSTFSGNTAPWGNAISNDGILVLDNNTVSSNSADIANYLGEITSEINVVILDNETVPFSGKILVTAKVTDDNDNLIKDINFDFVINGTEVHAVLNVTSGLYQGTYENDVAGIYVVNMSYVEDDSLVVKTATLKNVKGTYTDLQNQINNAEGTLDLPYDFAYSEEIDGDNFPNGVVIDDSIAINGNGFTISGSNNAALFNVSNGATLTLSNVTVRDTKADKGAAVYVDKGATLNADGVSFINNTATYRGGAIYSEGTVNVDNSVFDKNDITFRSRNDDNGGAAIYNLNGVLTINNTNITNSVKDIVIRDGNAGDLLVGVVVTSGETLINNSYFANNTGSWGGAISSLGYLNTQSNTLTVENTKFEGNNATFGGAIFVQSSKLVVDNCTFENNKGVGEGSTGTSMTQGGAIIVHPAGSSATITDSTFIGNSANVGGAVSLAGVDGDSVIDNCTFTDNTAASEGGAVYLWTQDGAAVTVKDSTFSGNTAPWGNAISNDGDLILSKNTISSTSADIANYYGFIDSYFNATFIGNQTIPAELGDVVELNATLTDDNGNAIYDPFLKIAVNGDSINTTYDSDKALYIASYTIESAGSKIISTNYDYGGIEKFIGILEVPKANATLYVTTGQNNKFKAGENVTVFVGLYDDHTGDGLNETINVIVNNTAIPLTIVDGLGSFNVSGLEPGQYSALGIFAGNDNYNGPEYDTAIFTVLYPDRTLSVEVEDIKYGETAIINITVKDADGNEAYGVVVFTVNGTEYTITVEGEASVEIAGLAVNEDGYLVNATLLEDEFNAEVVNDTESFTVSIADAPDFTVNISEATYPENVTITVTSDVDGIAYVTVFNNDNYDEDFEIEVINGVGSIDIPGLDAGNYNAIITYDAGDSYEDGEAYPDFTVGIATPDVAATIDSVTYPENAVIVLTSDIDGYVDVLIDGDGPLTFEVVAGENTIELPVLAPDEYDAVIIFYSDNDNYEDVELEGKIIVNEAVPEFDATFSETTYPDNVTVTITGTDGVYTVVVGDKEVNVTVVDGTGSGDIAGLTAGDKIAEITFNADGNYTELAKDFDFTVEKATIEIDPVATEPRVVDGEINVTFTLPADIDGTVLVTIDGEGAIADSYDGINYVVPFDSLTAGSHTVIVKLTDDTNYNDAMGSVSFTVTQADTPISIEVEPKEAGVENTITITLPKGASGFVLIDLDGTASYAEVDDEGVVVMAAELDAGNHTITVTYTGNEKFVENTTTETFNISKLPAPTFQVANIASVTYPNNVTITVTSDVDGIAIVRILPVDKEVNVTVVDGTGSIDISGLDVGKYIAYVSYDAGDNYETSITFKLKQFEVKPATPDVNVTIDPVTYPENAVIVLTSEIDGTVNVTVGDGETLTFDVVAGENTLALPVLAPDEYDAVIVFYSGNKNYENVTINDKVVVNEAVPEFDAIFSETTYPDNVTVTITGTDGVYTVVVGDKEVNVTVVGGTGSGDIAGLTAGDKVAEITFNADGNYTELAKDFDFTVEKATIEIDPVATEPRVVDGEINVTFTLPADITGTVLVTIDGEGAIADSYDGINYVVPFDSLAAGSHTVIVKLTDDTNYNDAMGSVSFTVSKVDPVITISEISGNVGDTVDAIVTIEGGDATGYILVDGVSYVVKNGQATVPVSLLTAGENTITVVYTGDDKYNNGTKSADYTVDKAASTIEISGPSEINVGDDAEISVTIPDSGNVTLWIDGTEYGTFEFEGTSGSILITSGYLPYGNYTITAQYLENDNYNASNIDSLELNVTKVSVLPTIEITGDNIVYGETAYVTVEGLPEDATGNITVTIDGKEYVAAVDGLGYVIVDVPELAAGTYELFAVTYSGDDKYEEHTGMATIIVDPAESSVVIDPIADVTYSDDVTVAYTVTNKTTVTVVVKDADGNEVTEGVAVADDSVTVSGLDAGEYTISITNAGDGNYSESSATATFNVLKADVTINPEATGDLVVDGKINVTFTLPDDIDGTVLVTIDGEGAIADSYDGINYVVPFDSLAAGSHTVIVKLADDTNYNDAMGSVSFTVSKVDPTITPSVEVGNYVTPSKITVEIDSDATGYILINVDGKQVGYREINKGKVQVSVKDLIAGEHVVDVIYTGDDKYNNGTASTTYTINKSSTVITVGDAVFTYKHDPALQINLTDENGNPVVNGLVYVNNTLTVYKYRTDAKGTITAPINLKPGEYEFTITFNDDGRYEGSNATKTVVINKLDTILTIENATVGYQDGTNYTMKLVDIDGNPVSGATISLYNGVKTLRYRTDSNGVATAPINLKPGQYEFNASYAGNNIYGASNMSSTVTVGKVAVTIGASDITVVYNDGSCVNVTLIDASGEAVKNVTVRFTNSVNDYRYHTDSNGVASAPIKLKPGEYEYTITFAGNSIYDAANATITVTVTKAQTTLEASDVNVTYNNGNITARLTDMNGNGINNVTVNFDSGSKVYKYRTDSNGVATAPVNVKPGEYDYAISFNGNNLYEASNTTASVVVNKVKAKISVEDVSMAYKDGTNYTVTVTDLSGNPLSGVGVKVNNTVKTSKYYTDSNGVVSSPIALKKGQYEFVAFIDDSVYETASATSTVVIS